MSEPLAWAHLFKSFCRQIIYALTSGSSIEVGHAPIVLCNIFYEARMGPFLESSMFQWAMVQVIVRVFPRASQPFQSLITNHFRLDLLAQFFLLIIVFETTSSE